MTIKTKPDLTGFPLRLAKPERATVERIQAEAKKAGVTASLNDVIRHLIARADVPVPMSTGEGLAAIQAHWEECTVCESHRPPRCLDGLYLRDMNRRRCSSG